MTTFQQRRVTEAIDVAVYLTIVYLTMVDCSPGRIANWKEIRSETTIIMLNEIFFERGPLEEVFLDNGAAFRSETLGAMCDRWKVRRYFRVAYRPARNRIV